MPDPIPLLPSGATPPELKKIEDEAKQRKAALDAMLAEANTRKALAEANKAQAEAEKAQAEAGQAASKARSADVPLSGYAGTAEMGAGAGNAETMLLGAMAVQRIAQKLSAALVAAGKPAGVLKFLLYAAGTVPDFQALQTFNAQHAAFALAMAEAEAATQDEVPAVEGEVQLESVSALGVATAGQALDTANKVLGYFRADYKFQGTDVASTDGMLLAALAGELGSTSGLPTQVPALYQPVPPATEALEGVAQALNSPGVARDRMRLHEGVQGGLEQALAAQLKLQADATTPAEKVAAGAAAAVLQVRLQKAKDAVATWKALAERLEAWATRLATADDKGQVPLATVVRQAALRAALDAGAALVVVQLHKVAGTAYTKKSFWSSLFNNPFFVMGGAVASMTAFNGRTGEVFSSALVPVHGGYHSVSDVRWAVNNTAWGMGG